MNYGQLQRMYARDEYYWGKEPNEFAQRSISFLPQTPGNSGVRAVDIGAGEGRDAVFFAKHGLDTLAVDVIPNGLDKAVRLAREEGVTLLVEQGDVNEVELHGPFGLIYSIGTIQYLDPANRASRFDHFKEQTTPGGINALFAFVEDPDIAPAPDWGPNEYLYRVGELREYYAGWELRYSRSFTFDDDSGGIPHQHAAEEYVFRRRVSL